MKRFLILGLLIFVSCQKENPVQPSNAFDDSSIPDSIKKLLNYDAAFLTFAELRNDTSWLNNVVEIPEDIQLIYYRELVAIHNMNDQYPFNYVKKIHVFPFVSLELMVLMVDKGYSWVRNLLNGILETGEAKFDSLVKQYKLQLFWISDRYVILYSPEPVNMYALSKKFSKIKGIYFSGPEFLAGDGNDLEAKRKDDSIEYTFSLGWGDCLSGCSHRHY
ncbi:MAG: hypothetical protein ACPL25_12110 [Ignavibacteria bacterium]